MTADALLCFCRAGFEPELAAELTERAAEADLLGAQGFDAAMQGCSAVLHTASPYRLGASADPERELIAPAVVGTRHVLEAVNRTASVQRVVVTSSIAAMFGDSDELQARPGQALNETDVNRTSTAQSNAYALSKTRAEALAKLDAALAAGLMDYVPSPGDGALQAGHPDLPARLRHPIEVAKEEIVAADQRLHAAIARIERAEACGEFGEIA